MQIIDRYTGNILSDSNLPDDIELGRYAIFMGSTYKELTSKNYKVHEGQRIHQELLDDVNKDKHNIFEIISESVENGDFRSIPLLQGIKNTLNILKLFFMHHTLNSIVQSKKYQYQEQSVFQIEAINIWLLIQKTGSIKD